LPLPPLDPTSREGSKASDAHALANVNVRITPKARKGATQGLAHADRKIDDLVWNLLTNSNISMGGAARKKYSAGGRPKHGLSDEDDTS
jgi:hypothetical protein